MKPVIIVGGGLAGLTAALSLAESGRDVTVYEASAVLGGKAASWRDGDGDLVEAGLHVCFPYYQRFLALLDRIGAASCIGWRDTEFAYLGPAGRVDTLRFRPLPPPLHGVAAILGDLAQSSPPQEVTGAFIGEEIPYDAHLRSTVSPRRRRIDPRERDGEGSVRAEPRGRGFHDAAHATTVRGLRSPPSTTSRHAPSAVPFLECTEFESSMPLKGRS